jgi:hypothetical protein
VIGIVAVLAVVVLTVLNPVEFLKKSRDSRRMVDLQTLDKALRLADFDNISMGTANVVYVSIPDDTAATSTCPTLSLPALPGGWTYQCSNTANYRKADGTGWVPVNFTTLTTAPNPLTLLPVDPTNSTSTNLYYSYVSGSWELTALFETTGYQTKYAAADNGTSTVLLEVGNHLKITPNAIASRTNVGGGGGGGPTITVPTLTTSAATDLAATTATLNGSITAEGGASSTIVGFQYGLTTGYGSEATSTYSGGTGAFSKGITGLTASTLYHFKSEAKNSAGWGYGSDATFTTTSAGPCGGIAADTSGTLNGNTVYCDEHNRLWTPTAVLGGSATTYAWGGFGTDEPTNSCIGISGRAACNYCDNLTYAGFDDWQLPSCVSGAQNSSCILYQFGLDACGSYPCTPAWDTNAQADGYWSSTEYSSNGAWGVGFGGGSVSFGNKNGSYYGRCVRGQ